MQPMMRPADLASLRKGWMTAASHVAMVDGCDLHWIDEGVATDLPAVLLLSAQWLGATHFDLFCAHLATRTRVVRLDLPGHGLSGPFPDGDYSAPGYARLVAAFLEHSGLPWYVIVGQSHSGIPAALTASEPRYGMAGLVLATSSGMPRQRAAVTSAPAAQVTQSGTSAWYASRLHPLLKRDHDKGAFARMVAAAQAYGELSGRTIESERRLRHFDPDLMTRVLPQVMVPTLVLWSHASTYLPATMAEAIGTLLPHCHGVTVIPQTGHLLLADAPHEAADIILAFLETLA